MIFRQLFDPTSHTYTYLIASGIGREAVVIDPVYEHTDTYIKLLDELNLKLVHIIDTHVHADHITASGRLNQLKEAPIVMGAQTKAEVIQHRINDGEKLNLGAFDLTALHTPGHTDDSYSFHLHGTNVQPRVFTGDTLLIRGTGRTDFQQGSASESYDSITNTLFKLPDETLVFPAHDYQGRTCSSIYEEKHFNPRLAGKSRAEYVEIMNNLNLPHPKLIHKAVPANLNVGLTGHF